MNLLKSVETTIANLVEGTFGRMFRSEVRPMELARKLAREMDAHRTTSVSRVYAPNEYSVWLSPQDRARYEGVEHEVIDELCAYLLEHARREDLILASPPRISFHTDDDLALGEFGI
jgi:FhaA, N-terminal domain